MNAVLKKRSKKAGLSPGALVHIGNAYTDESKIMLTRYDKAILVEKEIHSPDDLREQKKQPGILWINIDGLQDVQLLGEIGNLFGLHPLILEDILNTDQRPKAEDFTDYIFIVLKISIIPPAGICMRNKPASFWAKTLFFRFRKKKARCLIRSVKDCAPTREGSVRRARITSPITFWMPLLISILSCWRTLTTRLNCWKMIWCGKPRPTACRPSTI